MVEQKPSKLTTGVRFPSPAPERRRPEPDGIFIGLERKTGAPFPGPPDSLYGGMRPEPIFSFDVRMDMC